MRVIAVFAMVTALILSSAKGDAFDDLMGYTYEQDPAKLAGAAEDLLAKTPRDRMGAVEAKLIAVVASTNTASEAKAYACRLLQRVGTAACIPAVAPLLGDEELAGYARLTLERQGTKDAAAALREALDSAPDSVKPGILGSLGEMRDTRSVKAIHTLAGSRDTAIAGSAMMALGKIGDRAAATALLKTEPAASLQRAHADALIACGRQLGGETGLKLCEKAMSIGTPANRAAAIEAIGMLDARRGAELILADLTGDDDERAAAVLAIIAGVPGESLTRRLAGALDELPPPKQAALVTALGQRGDPAALDALETYLASEDKTLRTAAIAAVVRLGNADSARRLLGMAAAGEDTHELIRVVASMPGEDIDALLVDALEDDAQRRVAIQALVERDLAEAAPRLLECAKLPDADLQSEAWKALGGLGGVEMVGPMMAVLIGLSDTGMQDKAVDAVQRIVSAANNRAEAFAPVLAAYDRASDHLKAGILNLAASVGGPDALTRVNNALAAGNDTLYDAALRSLARWPNEQAAEELLELSTKADSETHRVLALRGYIRIAGAGEVKLSPEQRLAMYIEAQKVAARTEEKRQVIGGLRGLRHKDALPALFLYADDPELLAEVAEAVIDTARRSAHHHKEEARAALDKLIAQIAGAEIDDGIKQRAADARNGIK